ncbi:MAG: sugar phosphate isomerase/epimerase [Candidatus Omnitrophica bacterium]|nr:sugar phosphate isomerase/epimerase [Candidatus Omnitrophota bacterium]
MKLGFMMEYNKERIEFAKRIGFKSCELIVKPGCGFFPGDKDWDKKAQEVSLSFKENGITISCLGAFYINHFDPGKKEEGKNLVRNSILLAEKMGVGVAAGFSGRIVDKPLEDSLPLFKEVWSEHARFADAHNIKIAFEHCPMGAYGTPSGGINVMCTPGMWEKGFNEVHSEAIGLEWDPSHLIGLFIDPIITLRKFGKRVYHVHAKDAHINRDLLMKYGLWHPGVNEHCFPGLGDTDWNLCIKELLRSGYSGDFNIEGWHDAIYRNIPEKNILREDEGLIIAFRHLSQFVVQD